MEKFSGQGNRKFVRGPPPEYRRTARMEPSATLNPVDRTSPIGRDASSLDPPKLFLNPIFGVAVGAASGALGGALSDFGIDDSFMKELSATLQTDNAALFVLIKHMTADKVLKEIEDAGGIVLKTSLDETKEKALRDALASAAEQPAA